MFALFLRTLNGAGSWLGLYNGRSGPLKRFITEQGGEAKRQYHGLPSTAAGMALGSFFPFSQTWFFNWYLSELPGNNNGRGMKHSILMVSHVPTPKYLG